MFLYFAVCFLLFVPFAVALFVRRFVCVAGWPCWSVVGISGGTNFESWRVGCGEVAESGCQEDPACGGDLSGRGWTLSPLPPQPIAKGATARIRLISY